VQTVEQANPHWWSLLLAQNLERGALGLTRYVTSRRRHVFADQEFDEEVSAYQTHPECPSKAH